MKKGPLVVLVISGILLGTQSYGDYKPLYKDPQKTNHRTESKAPFFFFVAHLTTLTGKMSGGTTQDTRNNTGHVKP